MSTEMKRSRKELLKRVGLEIGRELSAETVFFHEVVARRLGLNATDTRCLDLIARSGRDEVTAGDLCRSTGLTTGAVTGVLDRLEAAGFVERSRDSSDRRKVFIRPKPEAADRVTRLYEGVGTAMMKLANGYETKELALISDFLERSRAILREQIEKLS